MAKRLTAKQRRARTYTVLVAIVLIGALIWALLWWFGSGGDDSAASPSPSPTVSAEPSPSETPSSTPSPSANYEGLGESGLPSTAPACAIEDIAIQAMTDKDSYGADEPVMMRFMIVNSGAVPCQMNVGTTQQDYIVSSGGATVFRHSHCASDRVDQLVTLEPGDARQTSEIEWDRRYSDEGACDDELAYAPGGGAQYTLSVVVAGIESQGTRDFVLQ